MQARAHGALYTAQRHFSRQACRYIRASQRYPRARPFHLSSPTFRSVEDHAETDVEAELKKNRETSEIHEQSPTVLREEDDTVRITSAAAGGGDSQIAPRTRKAQSGRSRGVRQRQLEGLPPAYIPKWFFSRNVKCVGGRALSRKLVVRTADTAKAQNDSVTKTNLNHVVSLEPHKGEGTPAQDSGYLLHPQVYEEILWTLRTALFLRPPRNLDSKSIIRPITILQCPKDGGTSYLDSIVETVSAALQADLVRLEVQDLAQLVGNYIDENLAWGFQPTVSTLSYDTFKAAGKLDTYDEDGSVGSHDPEGLEEEDIMSMLKNDRAASPKVFAASSAKDLQNKLSSIFGAVRVGVIPANASIHFPEQGKPLLPGDFLGTRESAGLASTLKPGSDQWNELKISAILELLISAADLKRTSLPGSQDLATSDPEPTNTVKDLIVQIKDYKEMNETPQGIELIKKLQAIVNSRWYAGRNIILVGTTSTEEAQPALSQLEIQRLQSDILQSESRTIFVPPARSQDQEKLFETDEKARIRIINIRHIEDMIGKLVEGNELSALKIDISKDLDDSIILPVGLGDAIWTYPRVHRLATTILGSEGSLSTIDGSSFNKAVKLLATSDEMKYKWGEMELKQHEDDVDTMLNEMNGTEIPSKIVDLKERISKIRKTCTPHEKKLLGGIVMPSDIKTTFDDVRVPTETVEALKTLTSLSLLRPEAFSYGVLATDRIPGLLLYGPPGSGKTLLAQAVAKTSGTTILEVSGADVNDMYVGEGEKNVKAIFSLAEKLAPCVVFIDEADAIFAARGEARRSSTHRELINQFLREWDGMNDTSAFIMVATNRPFDLDEAVLRRLPRRILVDLPAQTDREAILKIHLKGESLDDSVSLAHLAAETPLYSGSDLKNLCVAAALTCIREENAAAAAAQHRPSTDPPYAYPDKRTLRPHHFDKALEEISASISEDMSTLSAIRKFDEKYGDRKGRRKKGPGLGFKPPILVEAERDSGAGRVRKSEV